MSWHMARQAGGGQVSHLGEIKFNRVPGCEEVCEWEVKWEMGDLIQYCSFSCKWYAASILKAALV